MTKKWVESLKKIGLIRIVLLFVAGILLMVCSFPISWNSGNPKEEASSVSEEASVQTVKNRSYEEALQEELRSLLLQIESVTEAQVMITLEGSGEKIVDKNESWEKEADSDGAFSETENGAGSVSSRESRSLDTVLTGEEEPFVLQELSPKIRGVLILVSGSIGSDGLLEINEAVQALFSIDAHKIKVMKANL